MRIAFPKGRLLNGVMQWLHPRMPFLPPDDRCYDVAFTKAGVRGKIVKARAIPQLLALGNFQLGFCGHDLLTEYGNPELKVIRDLGLNRVRIVVAVPEHSTGLLENPPKRPVVIATEYEQLAAQWAMQRSLAHIILQTFGSTEGYAPEDADIVFDCVETGDTLRANGLVIIDEILQSSTCLVAHRSVLTAPDYQVLIKQLTEA